MTIRQYFYTSLIERGLLDDEANTIMEDLILPEEDWWNKKGSDFDDPILVTIGMRVDKAALKWIDANTPDAWFRGLFE